MSLYFLQVYFGCHFAKMYLMSDILRINSTTGMSCLLRKEVLEEAGGLKWFGQYLAEDYFMAQAFIDRYDITGFAIGLKRT